MSKQFKNPMRYVTSELNQPYSDNSQLSSNDELSCYPITESDNSEKSLVNKDQSNNQPSGYLISGKANENKERHFQNFMHSSFEQPSSHPIDEIPNGSSSMENKEKYFQHSPLSSHNQLISFPMTESDNGEISPVHKSVHLYNSMLSYCDQPSSYSISKNATESKETHFQNFTHSSIEQPSSYPISEIANGSIDVKEKYFQSSAASPSNQFINFPIAKSDNSEISSIPKSAYLHNSALSYDDQPGSYPINKSAKGSKETHFQNFIHSSVEKPNSFPISEITIDSSYTENEDKSFQRSLHSSSNQLISFPITESDNSERNPLLKSMDHDDSVFSSIDQPCTYPIKSNSNVNKYSGRSGMHFDDPTLSSVDQPSSYPISESANGHSTDSGVGREQKNTDDTGKGRSVGKAKIDSSRESVYTSPSIIGGKKTVTELIEPEVIIKSKPVEILVSTKLRGTFPAKLKTSEIRDIPLKQSAYRPRSISLGSANIPVTEKIQEKFSSLPNFRNGDRETNGKGINDFNKISKASQEETFVRVSGSWPQEFADLEHKLSDPQLIATLRTWYKESHHKIRLLHLFTATVKNLLLEYCENLSTKEDTPQALIIQLQNCLSYYHKEVDNLRIQVREAKAELEENHIRNAARYQSISEEHKIRLSQVIQDHEQQLSAAMDRALNARRQAASLQVQLTSALARNQQLEESNQQATQSSVTDNQNMLDNLKQERAALKFMVRDLEENLAKCRKKVKHLEEHNSSLQDQTHNGSVLEKDYMNQLERQLSSERALISTLKTELQQEHNRNQQLWAETKKHVQKSAVLQARLEAAYCEVVHKNKLLETLKEEILQKITKAFPDVLASLPQLTDSSTSVANWVTSMKQAVSNKENEIQKISKELAHLEKNVFDLSSTIKEKETVASTLTGEIQLTESKIISKNEELQLKREHINKIVVYIKNTEDAILSLQQKAVDKDQMLKVLKEELMKKDDKLTKTASKVKIERERFREILANVKTSEEELKMQSGKLKQMKIEKENLKGQCLLKENDIEYLTKVLESKKKIINEMEKDIMASNDIIKGLIQNFDNLGYLPNWQNRIDPNIITQIKHTPFTSETEYKALDDKTVIDSLRKNIELETPEHLSDSMNFGQKKEHKSFSSKKKRHKTLPVKMTNVMQGSPFSKFEIGSSIKVKSPSDTGSVYYTQNTDIGSFNPKDTSDALSTPTPLKLKQHTDVKVTSTPLVNTQALGLQHTSKRPSKAKKKLTYSDGKLEKISTGKWLTYGKHQGISLEPNSDIPILISGNLANSDYNLASSHSMKKTMILHNAGGRTSPVMVNVNIQPQPLLVTDSGEHFICDVAMDVYPLQKLHEHQQSKTTASSATREMQHGFNLEGTSETFILSDKECHTASSKEVKEASNFTENYKLQSQNHIKSLKTPENLQMLQSSGTFTVLTSKDNFSEEPGISGNEFMQQRHTVPILKNIEETNIISAQSSTQTPSFAFSTAPKSLGCSRDQSAVGKNFAYPSDIAQQQRHTNLPHTLTDSLCENTKDQVPDRDKLNHHLSQVKTPVTYKDFKHHHGLFWNKTFSPEESPYPKATWRIEKHGFPMENTNYDNISLSHNSLPDSQPVGTSTAVLSFQPTPHKDGYIKYSSPCHITRQVPESNIRLPVEGEENELYQIQ